VRLKRFFAIAATTVILLMLAVNILPAPALAAPAITLFPTSGTVGTSVSITGENFTSYAGDQAHIYFANTEVGGSPVTVPANGAFTLIFQVPDSALAGTALVTVRDQNGNQLAQAEFAVPQPFIIGLSPAGGIVGTGVTLTTRGFRANEMVTFTFSNHTEIELGSVKASDTGECTFSFNVPESTGREHKVIATDPAGNKAEAIFSVIPSIVLDKVSGAIGSKVTATGTGFGNKSYVSINFGENQVKTATADGNGSLEASFIVPNLALQTYTVEAVDAEGNSATATFTINAGQVSFVFPQWGIYALMGLGGLLLFILGIWIGRKYAYSY
jgi:hypothetical protein